MPEILCPSPAINTVAPVISGCDFQPGQIVKIIFQKVYNGSVLNGVSLTTADTLATWTALTIASDDTKIIVTPKVGSPQIEPGEEIELGGGNDTPEGVPFGGGAKASKLTANILRANQIEAIKELKKLYSIKGLGVFFVTHLDEIVGLKKTISTVDSLSPIPLVRTPFIGDLNTGQLESITFNQLIGYLKSDWSDDLYKVDCEGADTLQNG